MRQYQKRRSNPLLQSDQVALSQLRRPRDPAQPNLPFDPLPDRIEPCLALLKSSPPRGPDWCERRRTTSRISRRRPTRN
jgi:bifunctional non-homologous end joining protein LigD